MNNIKYIGLDKEEHIIKDVSVYYSNPYVGVENVNECWVIANGKTHHFLAHSMEVID